MKVVTVIQARRSSTRLPDKVLLPILGEPLLFRMLERVNRSKLAGTVVVATSTSPDDDLIEELCFLTGVHLFRGSLTDLLDRHYQLAVEFEADAIVKIPSDCPLIDPAIIDKVIGHFLTRFPYFNFVSNLHPPSYPDGNDVEIMSFKALKNAWIKAQRSLEREHTTPFIWENPLQFRIGNVEWETGLDYSKTHRWTIDYPEDYKFINEVFNRLYPENPAFGLNDILELLNRQPEIAKINTLYAGKYWYENHLDDLQTIQTFYNRKKRKHEA